MSDPFGTWDNKGLNRKDGANLTLQTLYGAEASFWTTPGNGDDGSWDSDVWTFENNKLPVLQVFAGQNGDGGVYLMVRDIQYATVTMDRTSFTYNGSLQRPDMTVTFDGETLVEGTDYTVAITSSNGSGTSAGIQAGTVTLIITGKGLRKK